MAMRRALICLSFVCGFCLPQGFGLAARRALSCPGDFAHCKLDPSSGCCAPESCESGFVWQPSESACVTKPEEPEPEPEPTPDGEAKDKAKPKRPKSGGASKSKRPARTSSSKPEGTEGGACYGNSTCNPGLRCVDKHCKKVRAKRPSCPASMAKIPGGELPSSGRRARKVSEFCLDKVEVSSSAYQECVTTGACTIATRVPQWRNISPEQRDALALACTGENPYLGDHPINCVSARQAEFYCKSRGKRLPTAAEWQWAAQGGEQARRYPWGDAAPSTAMLNACDRSCVEWFQLRGLHWVELVSGIDGHPQTAPVDAFARGAARWGLRNMAGNVWEWTSTEAPGGRGHRIVKGGSWAFGGFTQFTTAGEGSSFEQATNPMVGFRCARDLRP